MQIKQIAIDHYGPLRDLRLQPMPGLQVFFGPNESGKTLLIDAILKLMLGRVKDFDGIDRVSSPPKGWVSMVINGKEHIIDGNSRLDGITSLGSKDLRNMLVIRNKDLQMDGQAMYLQGVNDRLTGMESSRLKQLKEIIRKQGCLTNQSSGARLSKSTEFGKIGEHVERGEMLVRDIKSYLEQCQTNRVGMLELKLEECLGTLRVLNEEIKELELAKEWERHVTLTKMINELETLEVKIDTLQPYTKESFAKLQSIESRMQAALDTAAENTAQLEGLQPKLESARERAREAKILLAAQENNNPKYDYLEQQALLTAATSPQKIGSYRAYSYWLLGLTAIGTILAALDLLPPLIMTVPVGALAGAVGLLLADRQQQTKRNAQRRKERTLLQESAAAGIIAQSLQELAAGVAREKNNLQQARLHEQTLASQLRDLEQRQKYLQENLTAYKALAADLAKQLDSELRRLSVRNLEQFGVQMDELNRSQTRRDELRQRLQVNFGSKSEWRQLLPLDSPPNPGIEYSRDRLNRLRAEKDEAQTNKSELTEALHRHQSVMATFASNSRTLPLREELPASFANLEVLEHAAAIVEDFVIKVKSRFNQACTAITILEELEQQEQQKLTGLVGPNKPIQTLFSTITGNRYSKVFLDDEMNLGVLTHNGLELAATSLSQGTLDQLYLALRISLANDLLSGSPGFMLLDDAFLCADKARINRMLSALAELAANGWHILYFTMDQRLADAATDFTDNEIYQLNSLA